MALAQQADPTDYGPAKGTLIIVGGGNLAGTGIMETFINRAGGPARKLSSFPPPEEIRTRRGNGSFIGEEEVVAPWEKLGAE